MNKSYYITQPGGVPHGPYDLESLSHLITQGNINTQTLYFTEGMEDWAPITQLIPRISSHLAASGYILPPTKSNRSRFTFVLLGLFLGTLGIHNFYAGYTGRGLLQLLITAMSCIALAPFIFIMNLLEICFIANDADGRPLS